MFSSTRRFDPSFDCRVSTAREKKKKKQRKRTIPVRIPVPFIERSRRSDDVFPPEFVLRHPDGCQRGFFCFDFMISMEIPKGDLIA